MDKFLVVLICWPIGILLLKYRKQVKDFIGDVSWAERFLGVGGTNTLIIIIAFLVFIGSLMYAVGTLQSILDSTLGSFFR